MSKERREFQRLNLRSPIDAWFGDWQVELVDVSARGALIAHEMEEIPMGSCALLRFFWRGEEIEIFSQTVRVEGGRVGLSFADDNETLRKFITQSAMEVVRAQEANASGDRARNIVGDQTLTSASERLRAGYVCLSLVDGTWTRRFSLLPDQPDDGFTVSMVEPEEQIQLLCRTYEVGDVESRRLTRLLAELSVAASK